MDSSRLRVRIFADTGDPAELIRLARSPGRTAPVAGFTTNPTLLRRAGVTSYEGFARSVLPCVGDRPLSLEVLANDEDGMLRQARKIAGWGEQIYVKVPITDTRGEPTDRVIRTLRSEGVKVNVTAVLTLEQVQRAAATLASAGPDTPAVVSVFAGRIADTGRDPVPVMRDAKQILLHGRTHVDLLWASTREALNVAQADQAGCDIVTVTPEILGKLPRFGHDLADVSLTTVAEFHRDALASGLEIPC